MRRRGIAGSCWRSPGWLAGAVFVVLCSGCRPMLPLFSDDVGPCEDCDPGVVVEGPNERLARPSQPYPWAPVIDRCMSEGKTRTRCIDELPPELLGQLEDWESQNGEMRRRQLEQRRQIQFGGRSSATPGGP